MPKVSIIVPVYNVKKYLNECLDSIQKQTLKDIEIICIDDGSIDGSAEILDDYARLDSRFCVIHKKNEGYGKAMNVGFDNAKGEYIGIVESDDFIDEKMYEELYNCISNEQVDFVRSDFFQFYGTKTDLYVEEYIPVIYEMEHKKWYNTKFNIRDNQAAMLYQKFNWNGLYRREFIEKNHIKHNETPGASFQDNGFWFQTMIFAKDFLIMDKAYYHYRIDNISSSMYSREKAFAVWDEYDFIDDIIHKSGKDYEMFFKWSSLKRLSGSLANIGRMRQAEQSDLGQMIIDFYYEAIRSGRLAEEILPPYMLQQMKSLIENKQYFLDEINSRTRFYLDLFDSHQNIIIYGAGAIGKSTWRKLHTERVQTKVSFFAVSSENDNPQYVENIPVLEISKLDRYKDDCLIIVAIKEPHCTLVKEQLMQNGWKQILLYTELQ